MALAPSYDMATNPGIRALALCIATHFVFAVPTRASADPRAAELRLQYFAPSFRWTELPRSRDAYNPERRSLYFSPGIGGRYFPRDSGHGVLVDVEYRFDSRIDDPWLFCDPNPCEVYDNDFAVAHFGYAYRAVVLSSRRPRKRFWAFTPHVSFATGWSKSSGDVQFFPDRAALVGTRVGFDIDFHFRRFFLGWSFRYEADYDVSRSVGWSHFFSWNVNPVFRMGIDLGSKQPRYDTTGYR